MNKKYYWGIGIIIAIMVLVALFNQFGRYEHYKMPPSEYGEGREMMEEMALMSDSVDYAQKAAPRMLNQHAMIMPDPSVPTSDTDITAVEERLIIKTGELNIVVDDVRDAVKQVHQLVKNSRGFVVNSNINEYESGIPSAHITVRIPVEVFDAGFSNIKTLGKVERENVSGQDVTEEFVDLDAQVRNLKSTEEQFLTILRDAREISDVLAVQRELSNVRGQIDRLQGRMNYLQKSAALSTLHIYLSTDRSALPVVEEDSWDPVATFKEAVRELVYSAQWLGDAVIWLVVYLPAWILLGLIVWGVRKAYRNRK